MQPVAGRGRRHRRWRRRRYVARGRPGTAVVGGSGRVSTDVAPPPPTVGAESPACPSWAWLSVPSGAGPGGAGGGAELGSMAHP
ncbi:hypothetical protein HBB16_08580 [Pseudonocardia sp. MCCB 268]|nr:hypothetical protein [Pseudonocardia cytotoxica]